MKGIKDYRAAAIEAREEHEKPWGQTLAYSTTRMASCRPPATKKGRSEERPKSRELRQEGDEDQ
jgi:hypothetical protein